MRPPPAANRPTFTSRMPNFALSPATMRSHDSASSRPPAMAKPSIAAISGFSAPAWMNLCIGPMSSPAAKALRSMPELKPFPAPVNTPAVRPGSSLSSCTAFHRPWDRSPLMAFIASGRLRVMIITRSRRSTMTALFSLMCTPLLRWHPDAAVEPDGLGVEIRVGDALHHGEGEFLARTETLRE